MKRMRISRRDRQLREQYLAVLRAELACREADEWSDIEGTEDDPRVIVMQELELMAERLTAAGGLPPVLPAQLSWEPAPVLDISPAEKMARALLSGGEAALWRELEAYLKSRDRR
jgi:hypothetical protein